MVRSAYVDLRLQPGADLAVPVASDRELALYVVSGELVVEQTLVGTSVLAHLGAAVGSVRLRAEGAARAVLPGGVSLPGRT
ncbi:MAG: hypothetical protein ISP90_07945 [Nevskia sp.]|nr:hypothetical protein [Nevskia sp.]